MTPLAIGQVEPSTSMSSLDIFLETQTKFYDSQDALFSFDDEDRCPT